MAVRHIAFLAALAAGCTGSIGGIPQDDAGSGSGGKLGSGGTAGGTGSVPGVSGGGTSSAGGAPSGTCAAHADRCAGRACGDDGFDGSCGSCKAGEKCSLDGACVACNPSCEGKSCGDDGCGNSCGSCADGRNCSLGECVLGEPQDRDELWAMYHINQFRVSPDPVPKSCNHDGDTLVYPDPGIIPPSRLNAEMVTNARYFAQHVVDWVADTGQGFCGHQDPLQPDAPYRKGTYLGEVGLQNCWCGYVAPEAAPITGDPWHCGAMMAEDANEWGLGHVLSKSSGGGYQVQDIGTDHAYMTVLIENEALTTPTRNVKIYVLGTGIFGADDPLISSRPFRFMGDVSEVQLSEDSCFSGAKWMPYSPLLDFELSAGDGRKVVFARLRDKSGATFVSWDSIHLGPEPTSVDSLSEAIARVRSVRLPRLEKDGYDAFQYSLGAYREAEHTDVWWGHRASIPDPDASGGAALQLSKAGQEGGLARIWTGVHNAIPVGSGEIYFRAKLLQKSGGSKVLGFSYREDSGAPLGKGVELSETDFESAGKYFWFKLPYTRVLEQSLFYVEFWAAEATLIDRFEVWSSPRAMSDSWTNLTLDFSQINYRGMEIPIRFVNTETGAFEDGPRINPYCALCTG